MSKNARPPREQQLAILQRLEENLHRFDQYQRRVVRDARESLEDGIPLADYEVADILEMEKSL